MPIDWSEFGGIAGEDIEQWRPETVGDKIVGVITHLEVVDTKFGRRPVMVLDTDAGPRKVWASASLLRAELAAQNPQRGDKVGILFESEEDTGKGNPLKHFKIKVEKASTATPPIDPAEEPF